MPEVLSLQLTGWFHPMRGGGGISFSCPRGRIEETPPETYGQRDTGSPGNVLRSKT